MALSMGLADREYQRPLSFEDEFPEVEGHYARWVYGLVGALAAGFLASRIVDPDRARGLAEAFHLDPALVWTRPWQIVTYAFFHDETLVLALNLLGLLYFGRPVEGRLGARRFGAVLLAGTAAAGIVFIGLRAGLARPMGPPVLLTGMTGGLFAVMVAYALLFPTAEILWLAEAMPSGLFVSSVMAGALLAFAAWGANGVYYGSYLGGAAAAFVLCRGWRRFSFPGIPVGARRGEGPAADPFPSARKGSKEAPAGAPARSPVLEREVDRLLGKISAEGMEALTAEEKEFLTQASREYRK